VCFVSFVGPQAPLRESISWKAGLCLEMAVKAA